MAKSNLAASISAAVFLMASPMAWAQADGPGQAVYLDVAAIYPSLEQTGYVDDRLNVFGITIGMSVEDVVATATAQGFAETTPRKNIGRRFELGERRTPGHIQIEVSYIATDGFTEAYGGGVKNVSGIISYYDLELAKQGQYAELDYAFQEQVTALEAAFGASTECLSRQVCRLWETAEGVPVARFVEAMELTQLSTVLKMSLSTSESLALNREVFDEQSSIFERFQAMGED